MKAEMKMTPPGSLQSARALVNSPTSLFPGEVKKRDASFIDSIPISYKT
jgi:hypothetical protein